MSDLIDRQASIDALEKEYRCTDQSDDWDGLKTAMLIIESLPSAQPDLSEYSDKLWRSAYERGKRDAQPGIIHCRDCKWHNGEINQCNAQICASMYGEDFCSRAERREE